MKKVTDKQLHAVVDSLENGHAVLDFGNFGRLTVPKKYLPEGINESDVVVAEFMTDIAATERKVNLARAVLKEILKIE